MSLNQRLRDRADLAGRDRGAAFIEFALSVPFLLLIAMGIVEMGLGWMAANDVNSAARDAARAGTSAPAYATADRTILITVGNALSDKERAGIQKVVVFRADANGNPYNSNCLKYSPNDGSPGSGNGISGECNIYGPLQVQYAVDNPTNGSAFGNLSGCSGTIDRFWCPAKRAHTQTGNSLDYLGVYIKMKHDSVTHFNFGDMTIKRQAVFRLEPNYGS